MVQTQEGMRRMRVGGITRQLMPDATEMRRAGTAALLAKLGSPDAVAEYYRKMGRRSAEARAARVAARRERLALINASIATASVAGDAAALTALLAMRDASAT